VLNKLIEFHLIYLIKYGDWGLGIGDWGLGIGPNPQSPIPNPPSPIPNPQSPIPNPQSPIPLILSKKNLFNNNYIFNYYFQKSLKLIN